MVYSLTVLHTYILVATCYSVIRVSVNADDGDHEQAVFNFRMSFTLACIIEIDGTGDFYPRSIQKAHIRF